MTEKQNLTKITTKNHLQFRIRHKDWLKSMRRMHSLTLLNGTKAKNKNIQNQISFDGHFFCLSLLFVWIYTWSTSSYYIIIRNGILVFILITSHARDGKKELENVFVYIVCMHSAHGVRDGERQRQPEWGRLNITSRVQTRILFVDAFMTAAHDRFFSISKQWEFFGSLPQSGELFAVCRLERAFAWLFIFSFLFYILVFYFLFFRSFYPKCWKK